MGRPRIPKEVADEKFLVRLPRDSMEMLRHFAAVHGRSLTQEIRSALAAYIAEAMLDMYDSPEFVEEIAAARPDLDLDAEREKATRTRDMLRDAALGRSPSPAEHASVLEMLAQRASS